MPYETEPFPQKPAFSYTLNSAASGMQLDEIIREQKSGILGAAVCLIPHRLLGYTRFQKRGPRQPGRGSPLPPALLKRN